MGVVFFFHILLLALIIAGYCIENYSGVSKVIYSNHTNNGYAIKHKPNAGSPSRERSNAMKIIQLRKIQPQNGSKTIAFVDINTEDGIAIKSFRLAKFDDGNYAIQPPSRQATAKEKQKGFRNDYVSTVRFANDVTKGELLKNAIAMYEQPAPETAAV